MPLQWIFTVSWMLLIVGSCLLVFGTLNTKVDTYCCFSSKLAYDTTYWLYVDTNNLLPRQKLLNFWKKVFTMIWSSKSFILCIILPWIFWISCSLPEGQRCIYFICKTDNAKMQKSYLNTMTVVRSIMSWTGIRPCHDER